MFSVISKFSLPNFLSDNLLDNKTKDSDKDNQIDSAIDDKKKFFFKCQNYHNDLLSKRNITPNELKKREYRYKKH